MLTRQQVNQYTEDGFVIPDFKLSKEVLESIRSDYDNILVLHPEFRDFCPSLLSYDMGFLDYARNPEILSMVSQVIGPDVILWNASFFAKPALDGKKTPWHQDGQYWAMRPLETCTVWIAVDAATTENGCMRFLPGTHKDKNLRPHRTHGNSKFTIRQELLESEYDESKAYDVVLDEGQISLHDVYLLHGSEANYSSFPRRALTLRYMPATSVFDRNYARELYERSGVFDNSESTIFLMSGVNQASDNDFRIRSKKI